MSLLPQENELGFFEIRLESIGGLGANLAGKMLAEAGVLGLGLNGSNFSSYGSEKKGSPVKSFIRFCEENTEIRAHSPIIEPNIIGVFHEELYKTVPVASGLRTDGTILVNSLRGMDAIQEDLKLEHGNLAVVDALGIAVKEKTKLNTAMLGALFRICDFLDPETMRNVIRKTFEKKYPHLVEANINTFNRGYEEVIIIPVKGQKTENKTNRESMPSLGYRTQIIGGVIAAQGNSMTKDLSGSRQGFLPKFEKESCINCASCDTVCPDFCFVWDEKVNKKGRKIISLKGIDYQYCKGCLKCVETCPSGALISVRETVGFSDTHNVKHSFPITSGGIL